MATFVRHPAVAGRFYPNNPDKLLTEVRSYTAAAGDKLRAVGCVVPHAGYMYSGHVAGAVYGRLELPRKFVILCPNHTGMGEPLSIMSGGLWVTPLGNVEVDAALAEALKQACPLLREDVMAHRAEHALEVQLPFLQALVSNFSFVPIAVGIGDLHALQALGEAMAGVIAGEEEKPLLVASSDMNHYESDEITRIKDHKAIEKILQLDARGLFEVVKREDISMCGYGPAVAMLTAAKLLGAQKAQVVKYATSGDISGDRSLVVGYAGIAICA